MVHGKCKSVGCYAMTDALIEEIYGLAREAFNGGQTSFEVHAFPFRMTDENLARFKGHKWYPFWTTLKQGYDFFEMYRLPPTVAVCERRYVVNVVHAGEGPRRSRRPLPALPAADVRAVRAAPTEQQIAEERITVPGPKTRDASEVAAIAAKEQDAGTAAPTRRPAPLPPASALGFNQ